MSEEWQVSGGFSYICFSEWCRISNFSKLLWVRSQAKGSPPHVACRTCYDRDSIFLRTPKRLWLLMWWEAISFLTYKTGDTESQKPGEIPPHSQRYFLKLYSQILWNKSFSNTLLNYLCFQSCPINKNMTHFYWICTNNSLVIKMRKLRKNFWNLKEWVEEEERIFMSIYTTWTKSMEINWVTNT